ncbi:MAG: hypothetical protein IPF84_17680 [Proteobacteria bacterium]|nr:hypothetical protein [Pseudomonadota bacterium]
MLLAFVAAFANAAGDPFGQHHSPATQITPDNVTQLEPAWTHRNGDMAAAEGVPSSVSAQSTPILLPQVADGHLVYCTPFNRVIALDPQTGRERWTYDPRCDAPANDPIAAAALSTHRWRKP